MNKAQTQMMKNVLRINKGSMQNLGARMAYEEIYFKCRSFLF